MGLGSACPSRVAHKPLGLLGDHQSSVSENDLRIAFQRFMETAGIAAASEMSTEVRPGQGNRVKKENPRRMDLYVHNATSSNFAEGTQAATRWLPGALPARANPPGPWE